MSVPVMLGGVNVSVMTHPNLVNLLQMENDRIFVLIQQNGGNDGLNMVLPLDQYSGLSAVRSNILIPESQVLKLTEKTGLHPGMSGLQSLFQEAALTIVQNVGYENQNRSHFRSTDIWDSGSRADEVLTTGWMGRYLDTRYPGYPAEYPNAENPHPVAIALGPSVSETCQGLAANFSLAINDPASLLMIPGTSGGSLPDLPYGDELDFLRQIVNQTNQYAGVLSETSGKGTNATSLYPEAGQNRLADQLKIVARLISGGLKTKIYVVNINGFDTHANQVESGDTSSGEHAQLLSDLSEAILAFMDDLRKQGLDQRVLGATRSEFGRQIASNGSFGTDHGDAAPLLLFGSCADGRIIGDNPVIDQNPAPQSGVPAQIDFKNVFGSILVDWFGANAEEVRLLFSHDFSYLPLVVSCQTTTPVSSFPGNPVYQFNPAPNPFFDVIHTRFTTDGMQVRLSLINAIGQEVIVLENQYFSAGSYQLTHNLPELPPGHYYYQIRAGQYLQTVPMVHF